MKTIFLCLLLYLCCPPNASGAERIPLVTGELAPYTSQELDGYGFITEIVSLALQQAGIVPVYSFYPWKRCEVMVKNGRAWAAFPYSHSNERERQFLFSDTVGHSKTLFFYVGTPPVSTYETLQDLRKYAIGGVLGYFYVEMFNEAGIDLDFSAKELHALKKLAAGRVDLIPLNELVGWRLIGDHFTADQHRFGTLARPLRDSELKLMISKDYPGSRALLAAFNDGLRRAKATPDYRFMLQKYGLRRP